MRLIIGLGNPGKKYANNRHNVGFMVVEKLGGDSEFKEIKRHESEIAELDNLLLAKPLTMMNSSGRAVQKISNFYKVKIDDLWVIHDDLDIRIGEYKIQKGKGPRDHKGLNSIYKSLGDNGFWHVRIGVDNRDSESRTPGEEYVLQNFTDIEKERVKIVTESIKEDSLMKFVVN